MRLSLTALAFLALAACSERAIPLTAPDAPTIAGAQRSSGGGAFTEHTSYEYPLGGIQYVPCAAGGAGEVIDLSGTIHAQFNLAWNPTDGWHEEGVFTGADTKAVGETTGDAYRAPVANKSTDSFQEGMTSSSVMRLRFIGPGPNNNFFIDAHFTYVVDANGVLRVAMEEYRLTCAQDGGDPTVENPFGY